MTFGSLFAGIGGLDLGLERAGMECKWQVEIDEYARRVLAKHWPNVRRWDDIKTFPPAADYGIRGGQKTRNGKPKIYGEKWSVDLICGGFPCQDISTAGKRTGLHGDRSGLFFEALRVVELLRPRWLLLENVAALLNGGLDEVLGTLAEVGFDAEWHCLQAADFGAPHIRDRVFILAHANTNGSGQQSREPTDERRSTGETRRESLQGKRRRKQDAARADIEPAGEIPNSDKLRMEGRRNVEESDREGSTKKKLVGRSLQEARSDWWAIEPELGRVANGIPARVDRLRGIGNAVVPQIAEWLGRQIMEVSADS